MNDTNDTDTTYKFADLPDKAKARALDWYREGVSRDWEADVDDIATILGYCGFHVDRKDIHYSIGYTQSDYATFSGEWKAEAVDMAGLMAHVPDAEALHDIAAQLMAIYLAYPQATARIAGQTRRVGLWVEAASKTPADEGDYDNEVGRPLLRAAKSLEYWIYHYLRDELDYQTSDEQCTEGIEANGYDFDEDGKVTT